MKKLICVAVAYAAVSLGTGQAWGQNPYVPTAPQQNYYYRPNVPLQRPTVSPYIGLLRNNRSNMGLNYFSIVRPEIQMRDALGRQQAEQQRLAQETLQLQQQQQRAFDPYTQPGGDPITGASRTMPPTGHPTSLMNLQGRFLTR